MADDAWGAAPTGPPSSPPSLGDYQILSELGRGGMGVVALARAKDGQRVAIKLMRHDPSKRGALERFHREARLQDALGEEAGFVPLLDSGTSAQGPFIVMAFVPGGTLREKLWRGALEPDEAAAIVRTVAEAVGRAHARGIVHRDLKPENILFTASGRPLVADLGLAKHFSDENPGASQSVSLTREGVMKGTAGYMAPEQMADAKSVGPAADVFALGAILYECVTGEPAFVGSNAVELFARVDSGTFKRPSDIRARIPRWIEDAIEAGLERSAADRPADGAAFAALLDPSRAEAPAARPKGPLVLLALLGAVAAVVLALVFVARRAKVDGHGQGDGRGDPWPVGSDTAPIDSDDAGVPPPTSDRFPTNYSRFLASKSGAWRLTGSWGSLRWKHGFAVNAVAFSPDGKRIASGGGEWEARLWDASTGDDLGTTGNAKGAITAVAFGPSGQKVITGGADGRVRIQSALGGKDHQPIVEHAKAIVALAYSPVSPKLYSVSADGSIHVRVAGDTGLARVPPAATAGPDVISVAFSPDRLSAILVRGDGRAHLCTTEETPRDLTLPGLEPVNAVSYTPAEGKILFAAGAEPILYDPSREAVVQRFQAAAGRINALAVSPDGRTFAAASEAGVFVWDARSGAKRQLASTSQAVTTLAFSSDGARLVTGGLDRSLRLFEVKSGAPLCWDDDDMQGGVQVAASADGSRFAAICSDERLRIFGADRPRPVRVVATHDKNLSCVALTAGGDLALTGDWGGGLALTDAATGALKGRLANSGAAVVSRAATFTRDGRTVLTVGDEPALRVWDVAARELRQSIPLPSGAKSVSVSAAGDRAVVATPLEVLVFDLATGAKVASLQPEHGAWCASISADGTLVATANSHGDLGLWDVAHGTTTALPGNRLHSAFVLFSEDTTRLLSGFFDRRLKVWQGFPGAATADEVSLTSTADTPITGNFTADGRTILVGTLRGLILRYEAR